MGFEPHSVAGSALGLASRLPQRGPAPSVRSPRKGLTPFEIPCRGFKSTGESRGALERAMGFEPTTTCLGSKDSTTELRPLANRILRWR